MVQALHSVDTGFADLAKQHDWEAGSTAVLALLANGSLLTAHVGDSRALICQAPWAVREAEMAADDFTSETPPKSTDRAPHSSKPGVPPFGLVAAGHAPTQPAAVCELTEDHSPDRPGEAARIAAAGGFVTPGGPGEAGTEPAGAPFSRSPRARHAVWDELWLGVALLGHHTPEHLVWRFQTIRGKVQHPWHAGTSPCRRLCHAPAMVSCLADCHCVLQVAPPGCRGSWQCPGHWGTSLFSASASLHSRSCTGTLWAPQTGCCCWCLTVLWRSSGQWSCARQRWLLN